MTSGDDDKDAEIGSSTVNALLNNEATATLPAKPKGWGMRHTLAFLGFWAFAISYAMRFNLSIAIVAMVNNSKPEVITQNGEDSRGFPGNISIPLQSAKEEACVHLKAPPQDPKAGAASALDQGEFHWDSVEQGIILGSFFWGYVLTQLPGGILATKYGGKWTLGLGLFVTAIFAILTPILARTHVYLLVLARVIQGLGEGVTTPAMHAILASWAPPHERSVLGSVVYAGAQFGTAVTMIISGYLINAGIMGGWPSIFYVIGAFSILWLILWTILMYDTPATHPWISQEELVYIQKSIGNVDEGKSKIQSKGPTPWLEIFKSVPMWAIMVAHVGHAYGLYTLLTLLPTYLKTALHFDMKENSWISALPYLVMWVVAIAVTQLADHILSKKILSVRTVRVTLQTIGQVGSALALIGASYSGCDRKLTVALLTMAVGMNGAIYGGYVVNHVDISPNWAGILMGITNTVANLTGFAAPYIAGLLINDNPSIQNWQYVFFIAAAIYFADVIFYAIFASGTEQPWNRLKNEIPSPLEEIKQAPKLQENKKSTTADNTSNSP